MKSQILHTVWCNSSGEAAGEIWNWSLLGVKGLTIGKHICLIDLHTCPPLSPGPTEPPTTVSARDLSPDWSEEIWLAG